MSVEIKKILGEYVISHQCPECGEEIINNLDEAGAVDSCADCKTKFKVPGELEAARLRQQQADQRGQKMAAKLRWAEATRIKQASAKADEWHQKRENASIPSMATTKQAHSSRIIKLADTAAGWLPPASSFLWTVVPIIQGIIVMVCGCAIFMSVIGASTSSQTLWEFFTIVLKDSTRLLFAYGCASVLLWLTNYVVRIHLGLIAAVLLIERHLRPIHTSPPNHS